jgi:hypothetical protein
MRELRQSMDARNAATEALLRGRRAALDEEELHAAIAGAWRRIERERFRLPPRRRSAWRGLLRLLVPSMALACFLVGLCIGLSLEPTFTYDSTLSDLARHPLLAELAP